MTTRYPVALLVLLSACKGTEDDDTDPPTTTDCTAPDPFPEIDGDTVIPAGGCYLVDRDVTVGDQNLLTLEPGVTLLFQQGTRLNIDGGKLNAEGTAADPIWLTGEQEEAGFWEGVRFHNSDFSENVLSYVRIEYGGTEESSDAGLYLDDDSGPVRLSLTDSLVMGSSGYGVYMEQNSNRHNLDAFSDNTITGNGIAGAMLATQLDDLDGSNSWVGNDEDFVDTEGVTTEVGIWPALDVPYRVMGNITVNGGGVITIAEGAHLAFSQGTDLEVEIDGALTAQGSDASPVLFSGTQQTPGFWDGLIYHSTSSIDNVLDYAIIEYAGGEGSESAAALYLDDDSGQTRISVDNTIIRESAGWAMYAEYNSNHPALESFTGNTITANAKVIRFGADDAGELSDTSTYSGNDADYVEVDGEVVSVQTWDTLDVPYRVPTRVQIEEGGGVTLTAGTTIEHAQNADFEVYQGGYLTAVGSLGAPIVFTGTQATLGYWGHLLFHSTAQIENTLDYVTVEYGGGDAGADDGLLYLDDDSGQVAISISNSTFQHGNNYGIFAETNSFVPSLTCSTNTYTDVAAPTNVEISCP